MASNKGVVLGFFDATQEKEIQLTDATREVNEKTSSKLLQLIKQSNLGNKKGKSRVFYGLHDDYPAIAVVSLGKRGVGYNALEEVDEGRENIRSAVAIGVRSLNEAGFNDIRVDPCTDAQAAAEAANLCTHVFDELKADKKPAPKVQCYLESSCDDWRRGTILAEAQNFARRLMETPANVMTPTRMGELAREYIGPLKNVNVQVHDREWAESQKMGSYLSVTNGSVEPPKFIEIEYKGGKEGEQCVALVGKGITFDAGGISLKPPANMDAMRADMGGAACCLASVYAAARLEIPINIRVFTPCCENLPSGSATKPGDVVRAMNGKTIQIDNTDAEGRLALADALCYAQTFKPKAIIDMATLTGAIMIALGAGASGVYTNSDDLWNRMHNAGKSTGDRVWRMPLFNLYKKQINDCQLADINNIGSGGRNAGSCTAAAFLKEFVDHDKWMHMDIAGVMSNKGEVSYLTKGMAGRPTRTVVEFLQSMTTNN